MGFLYGACETDSPGTLNKIQSHKLSEFKNDYPPMQHDVVTDKDYIWGRKNLQLETGI